MPLPDVDISPVRTAADLDAFIQLPWRIYDGDPNWVPPLRGELRKLLDRKKHPFHQHADVEYFLARRRGASGSRPGEVVGRIAAIVNHAHNDFHEEKTGFFGFFESVPDQRVASLLLQSAEDWLRQHGQERMRGPASFSSNEEWGLLVDGFDSPPMVMMTYNPRTYVDLLEGHGLTKAKDLVAYWLTEEDVRTRVFRLAAAVRKRRRVDVRRLDMRRFRKEVEVVRDLYNQAWEKNWGFVPMTDAEIDQLAKDLKSVIDPSLVAFAEKDGRPIGFVLALPDATSGLQKADGRLFPFGFLHIRRGLRRAKHLRVLTLGVLRDFRNTGADILLYASLFEGAVERGIRSGELSWVLEDNEAMRKPLESIGARVYKTYRIYEQQLGGQA